jgi:tetratricopeptide (TPR) repeat protein
MKLKLTTSLTNAKDAELRRLLDQDKNMEALRELLIRSVNAWFPAVKKEEALALCDEQLKKNPRSAFFNLVRACHSNNTEERKKYFDQAARYIGREEALAAGEAAYLLAGLYQDESKDMEAQAWIAKAILCGSAEAEHEFLGVRLHHSNQPYELGRFSLINEELSKESLHPASINIPLKNTSQALSLATFLVIIMSDSHFTFNDFTETGWYAVWNSRDKDTLLKALLTERERTLLGILEEKKPTNTIARCIVNHNPFIFHDYINYCVTNQIITDELYFTYMRCIISLSPIMSHDAELKTTFSDTAYYSLGKYILLSNSQDKEAGYAAIEHISPAFTDYKACDFAGLKKEGKDQVLYKMFILLLAKKKFKEAQSFLETINKADIQSARCYDQEVFNYFKAADPEERDFDIFRVKQQMLTQVMHALERGIELAPAVSQYFFDIHPKLESPTYISRMEFFRLIALMDKYPAKTPKEKQNRQSFEDEIRALATNPALNLGSNPSTKEFQDLKTIFIAHMMKWSAKLRDAESIKIIAEANAILDGISKFLNTLEKSKRAPVANMPYQAANNKAMKSPNVGALYPTPKVTRSDEEFDELTQLAIRASMKPPVAAIRREPKAFTLKPASKLAPPPSSSSSSDAEFELLIELAKQESLKMANPVSAQPIVREPPPPAYAPLYSPEPQVSQPPSFSLPSNPEAQAYFQNVHQLYASAAAIPVPYQLPPLYQAPVMAGSEVRIIPMPSAPLMDVVPRVATNASVIQPASNEADLLGLMTPVVNDAQRAQLAQSSYSAILEQLQSPGAQTPLPAAVICYPETLARVPDNAQPNLAVSSNPFALNRSSTLSAARGDDDLLEPKQYKSIYPSLSSGSGK